MKKSPWELVCFYHTLAVEVEYSIMHWNLLVILAESTGFLVSWPGTDPLVLPPGHQLHVGEPVTSSFECAMLDLKVS